MNYRVIIGINIIIVFGNNIIFVCVVEGFFRFGVFWWKGDFDLNVNEIFYVVYVSDMDVIGVYFCVVSNLGGFFMISFFVIVFG